MTETRKTLLTELIASCALAFTIIIVYECQWLLPGMWVGAENHVLVMLQFIMQLTTLAAIPLALFLFKIGSIRDALSTDESHVNRALLMWGTARMMLLCVPMVANVFLYYATGEVVSYFYLAVILALSLVFIYPSKKRCEHECHLDNPTDE